MDRGDAAANFSSCLELACVVLDHPAVDPIGLGISTSRIEWIWLMTTHAKR